MIEAAAAGFLLLLVVVALEADDAIHGIAEFCSGAKKSPFNWQFLADQSPMRNYFKYFSYSNEK